MDDVLARFRPKTTGSMPGASAPPIPKEPEREEYAAFGTKDNVGRLRIRRTGEATYSPAYGLLLNLIYDAQCTHFILEYSFLVVLVRGRNLRQLIFAVENEKADFIQQFDASRWPQPDGKAAFIEIIEVADRENAGKLLEAQDAPLVAH